MNSSLPRLRNDLILRTQHTVHGTSVVIKDPVSRKFFRLGDAEHFIVQQLDGETSPQVIQQRAEAKFGAVLPVETLNAFLQNLKKNGVLETAETAENRVFREPPRFRGSPLYCRFKVFDPCQLLQRLVARTGFFYTSYFGVLSAAAILVAAGVTITHWSDFRHELPRLYGGWSSIAVVLALNFLVVGAHEFGHGLTCARFGGEVHEMGCALVFLQPAFYCNVSDAWLFPEKSKRLWVGFAGPYFELFLWSLAVLMWRLTEPDTWIHFITLSVMATSGLKTLLNFNPLIKLDGYYLLSDYLEIPNLRRRSFRYVGSMTEKLFGLEPPEVEEDLQRRERAVFSIYGTVALAGSFSILGYIFLTAGGALINGRSPTTVLVTLGLLGMKYRRRFRRMFGKPSGAAGSFDDEDFETPDETEQLEEPAVAHGKSHFEMPGAASSADQPVRPRLGDLIEAPAVASHIKEPAPSKNGNNFLTEGGASKLTAPDVFRTANNLESEHRPMTSDGLLRMMYGRRLQKSYNASSSASDTFGGSETIETPQTVAVLDEPALPRKVDRFAESSANRRSLENAVPKNGDGVSAQNRSRSDSVHEPASSNNGYGSETGTAPSSVERELTSKNGDDSETKNATIKVDNPVAAQKKRSRRVPRLARRIAWATLAACGAIALIQGQAELRVQGPFYVLPIDNSDVRAAVDGIIDKIYVHEGDHVKKGGVIARLYDKDLLAQLHTTEAQIAQTNANLDKLMAGPTNNEIEVAKANVTKAADTLKYAQMRLAMMKRAFDEKLLSRKEYDDAAALESAAKNDLAVAEDQLKLLVSGSRPEDIEATKAQVKGLQIQRDNFKEQLRFINVLSPSTGIVATPSIQLKQMTHQLVKKGDLIAKVYDMQTMTVEIAVPEKEIGDVEVGQKVLLRALAYPGRVFNGTATFISTSVQGDSNSGEQTPLGTIAASTAAAEKRTVLVMTQIENPSLLLKPEMTGQAKILCGRRRAVDLITRRLAHSVKVEFWSWW